MKKRFFIGIMLFIFSAALVFAGSDKGEDAILGKWMVEAKDCIIEIYKKEGKFYGKIVWLKEPNDKNGKPVKDRGNPDPALQDRTILGLEMIYGFVYKDEAWKEGRIYNPENGKVYYCKLSLNKDGNLKLRGSLDKSGLLGQTQIWTREK